MTNEELESLRREAARLKEELRALKVAPVESTTNIPQNGAANIGYDYSVIVKDASPAVQAEFYQRTFGLVALSCLAFGSILAWVLSSPLGKSIHRLICGNGWPVLLGAFLCFFVIQVVAQCLGVDGKNKTTQIFGLGLYILADVVIFTPLLSYCFDLFGIQGTLSSIVIPAFTSTLLLSGGLIATVFLTKRDFSFLRTFVIIGCFVALAAFIVMIITETPIAAWAIIAMIIFMAAVILYNTWTVRTQLRADQHVGAAVIIFGSISTLFFYFIRLFLAMNED